MLNFIFQNVARRLWSNTYLNETEKQDNNLEKARQDDCF